MACGCPLSATEVMGRRRRGSEWPRGELRGGCRACARPGAPAARWTRVSSVPERDGGATHAAGTPISPHGHGFAGPPRPSRAPPPPAPPNPPAHHWGGSSGSAPWGRGMRHAAGPSGPLRSNPPRPPPPPHPPNWGGRGAAGGAAARRRRRGCGWRVGGAGGAAPTRSPYPPPTRRPPPDCPLCRDTHRGRPPVAPRAAGGRQARAAGAGALQQAALAAARLRAGLPYIVGPRLVPPAPSGA